MSTLYGCIQKSICSAGCKTFVATCCWNKCESWASMSHLLPTYHYIQRIVWSQIQEELVEWADEEKTRKHNSRQTWTVPWTVPRGANFSVDKNFIWCSQIFIYLFFFLTFLCSLPSAHLFLSSYTPQTHVPQPFLLSQLAYFLWCISHYVFLLLCFV